MLCRLPAGVNERKFAKPMKYNKFWMILANEYNIYIAQDTDVLTLHIDEKFLQAAVNYHI